MLSLGAPPARAAPMTRPTRAERRAIGRAKVLTRRALCGRPAGQPASLRALCGQSAWKCTRTDLHPLIGRRRPQRAVRLYVIHFRAAAPLWRRRRRRDECARERPRACVCVRANVYNHRRFHLPALPRWPSQQVAGGPCRSSGHLARALMRAQLSAGRPESARLSLGARIGQSRGVQTNGLRARHFPASNFLVRPAPHARQIGSANAPRRRVARPKQSQREGANETSTKL